ncbi:hypothetical protein H8E88_19120 [candidate division KSB1 bacterium]|nr:hypothetical protein [candidate division KSB1 bacterium]MBL7093257.1 hypothetical protein [candidate division KSB1 bacterium]
MFPTWWNWELELTSHLEKRMVDRDFSEIDLRIMLENASVCIRDKVEGRWMIKTKYNRKKWEMIVEPDF